MSITLCAVCDRPIDTDAEPECYVPDPDAEDTRPLCWWCREELEELED